MGWFVSHKERARKHSDIISSMARLIGITKFHKALAINEASARAASASSSLIMSCPAPP